jgi:hypothetical protein
MACVWKNRIPWGAGNILILYCERLRMNSVLWSSCIYSYFDSLFHLKIKELKTTNLIIQENCAE